MLDLQPLLPVLARLVLTDQPVSRRALAPPVQVCQIGDVFLHRDLDLPVDALVPNRVPQQFGPQLKVLPNLGLKLATKSINFGLLRSVLDVMVGPDLVALLGKILAIVLLVPGAGVVDDLNLAYF